MKQNQYALLQRIRQKLATMKKTGRILDYAIEDEGGEVRIHVLYRQGHPVCIYTIARFMAQWRAGNIDRLSKSLSPSPEVQLKKIAFMKKVIHECKTSRPRRPYHHR